MCARIKIVVTRLTFSKRMACILQFLAQNIKPLPSGYSPEQRARKDQEIQMIRQLNITDYNGIIDLWKKADLEFKPNGRDNEDSIRRFLAHNPESLWGYFKNNVMIASIMLTDDGRKGWINRLVVDPQFRHQGIAKAMIDFAVDFFRNRGVRIITALIESDNQPSQSLFTSKGFERCNDIVYFRKRLDPDI